MRKTFCLDLIQSKTKHFLFSIICSDGYFFGTLLTDCCFIKMTLIIFMGNRNSIIDFKFLLNWPKLLDLKPWKLWIEIHSLTVVMGPGQNFLTWVRSGKLFMVWVWIWKISPKNVKFFDFFPFGSKKISSGWVKKYPGQSLINCGSKVSSGRVRAHL